MGWPNDTYVDGKNILLSGKRIYVIMDVILPNVYLKGMFSTKTGIVRYERKRDMRFADMMDNYGFMQNHSFRFGGRVQNEFTARGFGIYQREDGNPDYRCGDRYERANLSSFLSLVWRVK